MKIEHYFMMDFIGKHIGMVILVMTVVLFVWAIWGERERGGVGDEGD